MDYGRLRVTLPGGETREHTLDSPSAYVGRDATNHITLDDVSVDRRHARLTIESGRLLVEDLGSANGTVLGDARLAPHTRHVVEDAQVLRFGRVMVQFLPGAALQSAGAHAAMAGGPAASAAPAAGASHPRAAAHAGIGLAVNPSTVQLAAGASTGLALTVHNRGSVVDDFALRVEGLPAEWVSLNQSRVSLVPAARGEVLLTLRPPRSATAAAGEHVFFVVATSRERGAEARAQATLSLLPFEGLEFAIQPTRSTGSFRARLMNTGNAPAMVTLSGRDAEDRLEFTLGEAQVELPPGVERTLPVRVKDKRRGLLGTDEVLPFKLEARAGNAAPAAADGQLLVHHPLQAWRRPALAVLALGALLVAGVGYTRVCGDSWPACPGDEVELSLSASPAEGVLPAVASPATSGTTATPVGASTGTAGGATAAPGGGTNGSTGTTTTPPPQQATATVPSGSATASSTASSGGTTPEPAVSPSPPASVTAVPPLAAAPSVSWLVADHAGTGAVNVHTVSETPVKASLSIFRPRTTRQPAPLPEPSTDENLATDHVLAIATFGEPAGFSLTVTDDQGRQAFATLEVATPVSTFWGGKAEAPKVSFPGRLRGVITWTLVRPSGAREPFPAEVLLLSKRSGCSTADQCRGELVDRFPVKVGPAAEGKDTYQASFAFPDTKHDYQVLLAVKGVKATRGAAAASSVQFFQFDIPGSQIK
jgi:predicted component of type VI protein secretion system